MLDRATLVSCPSRAQKTRPASSSSGKLSHLPLRSLALTHIRRFWPTTNKTYTDDLILWTNGGPGCSSLEGFLQENGPVQWQWGQAYPSPNPYPWTNLSHVLWVEQPVGTGFSQGVPNITNDDELAAQLAGFLTQFLEVFSGLKKKNFYLTGEVSIFTVCFELALMLHQSYAGYYVPYIANYLYEHPGEVDLDLKGIWISDPSLSYGVVQEQIPALRFAQANSNLFPFTNATWTMLQNMSDTCNYTDYFDKYVTYPPAGLLPLPGGTARTSRYCDIWDTIGEEANKYACSLRLVE
jgi:carboxypeptidase D